MDSLGAALEELDRELQGGGPVWGAGAAVQRWHADCLATRFHLRERGGYPPLVAVVGGTGTGKSTLVNRLLEAEVCATSLRRTFTSGAVAIVQSRANVPEGWLDLPHEPVSGPARGRPGALAVVQLERELTGALTLIDTPDLDGDQPAHHAEADRVFRWAQGIVFLVTPEKYQMTELLSYYRLARRYALPAVFVMNKAEQGQVVEDYRRQLGERDWPEAAVFAVPRDDAAYEPSPRDSLSSLRGAVGRMPAAIRERPAAARSRALGNRLRDLMGRLHDQIMDPFRRQRGEVDRLVGALRAMTSPPPGVDVSPVTQQLQRRLQEQSILYLMGPQRVLDRVRQVPSLLARLPRTAWDLLIGGRSVTIESPRAGASGAAAPDFPAILADQFTVLHSRIEDLVCSSPLGRDWMGNAGDPFGAVKIASAEAARIAEEELAALKGWLDQRWHGTPRDTAVLMKLLRALPGGKALTRWSEAAPYLLAVVVAAHHAFFGPIDLLILGSYSLAMWLGEKLSNEVTWRTRQANRAITERFARLSQEQIDRVCAWLERRAPDASRLSRLQRLADTVTERMGRVLEDA